MVNQKEFKIQGLNNDDNLELLGEGDYLNLLNGRIGLSEQGKSMRIENVMGTTALANAKYPPYGVNQTIGGCMDIEGRRLIWFVYNTFSDHGIYCYSFDDNQVYAVLYDSQIQGGLGFDKNYRIDRNCRVVNGLLYWTDNLNEPKKINIESGIKLNQPSYNTTQVAYQTLTDSYEITVIRRPPAYPPTITKAYDSTYVNNFVANQSWQFAWQYIYFDGEISVLAEFSTASKMNLKYFGGIQISNYINCTLSLSEQIPQTARIIRLIAKNQINNSYNVVKTYDKLVDSTPFTNHNNGSIQLSFNYYGDVVGETIDAATSVKPYDSVPLLSKTLETAVSRIFLGNNLSGYASPTSTSLAGVTNIATISASAFAVTGVDAQSGYPPSVTGSYKMLFTGTPAIGDLVTLKIYFYDTTKTPSSNSIIITYTAASTTLTTEVSAIEALIAANSTISAYHLTAAYVSSPVSITLTTSTGSSKVSYIDAHIVTSGGSGTIGSFFKNESSYQLGTTFYDKARRKCGVVTNSGLIISTPLKTYANSTAALSINWTLSNINALTEIPSWAYYYSIDRTLNLKTRFFMDSVNGSHTYYADKNATSGVYEYTSTTFVAASVAIAIGLDSLLQANLGYTYTAGDMCVIVTSTGSRYELPIIGTDSNYLLVSPTDIGNVSTLQYIYEIYTPYIKTDIEPFYEVGNLYPIINAGTNSRVYSTLSGSLYGDAYILARSYNSVSYYAETMSPNDAFYKYWITDAGFINYVTLLGQVRNKHEIRYSNVFTAGTQNNGLSTFEALNFKTTPLGTGEINKLQLASKTEEQGVIMLSINSFQTVSCYLGEVQVIGASQNAFLAQDTSVIGTMNVLKGMFGTNHPETVIEYLGYVFWYDLNNGAIVQYSSNGLFPISSYKMASFFHRYAKDYQATSSATLDTLNGFHHIPTSIDPFTKRFQITLPSLIDPSTATVLPSYGGVAPSYASSIINRFNPYTKLGQTVCFDILENRWKEIMEYTGEFYDYFQNTMFGFKNGTIYTHNTNSSTWNTFYGVQYPMRYCFTANPPISSVKDVTGLTVEGIDIPNYSVLYSEYPYIQITDMTAKDYRNQEGIQYSNWYRDRLSPNVNGTTIQKMYYGSIIKSKTPLFMIEFQQYTRLSYFTMTDTNFAESTGQKQILKDG